MRGSQESKIRTGIDLAELTPGAIWQFRVSHMVER